MSQKSKLTRSAINLKKYESILKCPICASPMKVVELRSIVCAKRHTFDIARQGYVHFLTKPSQTQYNKDLFTARKKVIKESQFFAPLMATLTKLISNQTTSKDTLMIADMGSGEGSHLHTLCENLRKETNEHITGVGLDISKEGVLQAAKNYEEVIWLVADLAQPPIHDETIDV